LLGYKREIELMQQQRELKLLKKQQQQQQQQQQQGQHEREIETLKLSEEQQETNSQSSSNAPRNIDELNDSEDTVDFMLPPHVRLNQSHGNANNMNTSHCLASSISDKFTDCDESNINESCNQYYDANEYSTRLEHELDDCDGNNESRENGHLSNNSNEKSDYDEHDVVRDEDDDDDFKRFERAAQKQIINSFKKTNGKHSKQTLNVNKDANQDDDSIDVANLITQFRTLSSNSN
jgi:hypothetical protein